MVRRPTPTATRRADEVAHPELEGQRQDRLETDRVRAEDRKELLEDDVVRDRGRLSRVDRLVAVEPDAVEFPQAHARAEEQARESRLGFRREPRSPTVSSPGCAFPRGDAQGVNSLRLSGQRAVAPTVVRPRARRCHCSVAPVPSYSFRRLRRSRGRRPHTDIRRSAPTSRAPRRRISVVGPSPSPSAMICCSSGRRLRPLRASGMARGPRTVESRSALAVFQPEACAPAGVRRLPHGQDHAGSRTSV